MSLEARITEDLKEAMRSKDQAALRGIRAIKAAILLVKTDGSGNVFDEAAEVKLLQKLVKQRQDSHDIFVQQNRQDLASVEAEEINIIMKYLPKQLTDDEIKPIVQAIIDEVGATSAKDMGKVMAVATPKLSGQADGKRISAIVKALLP
jgi:uncharacterized protein